MTTATSSSVEHDQPRDQPRGQTAFSHRYEAYRPASGNVAEAASRPANGHANGHDVAPLHLPAATPAYRPPLQDRSLLPDGRHGLSGISMRAFGLGIGLGFGLSATILLAIRNTALWRAPFFVAALAMFHFLEFWVTATYNTPLATPDAFLLTSNGWAYNAAHVSALLETLILHSGVLSYDFSPRTIWSLRLSSTGGIGELSESGPFLAKVGYAWTMVGFGLVFVGQIARSMAMITAGRNFNHAVQTYRRQEHELVTGGIYAYLRHPSYFGFFWWAIGTQVVLGNVVCLFAYAIVLWRFFSDRVRKEEALLLRFFDKEYAEYRRKTVIGIPGI